MMTGRRLHAVQMSLLAVMLVAWPWGIYQRLPWGGLTMVKLCGGLLLVAVGVDAIAQRRWPLRRTGIEWPLALLFAACLMSLPFSADRPATIGMLSIYASYVVFFYAAIWVLRQTDDAWFLSRCFAVSGVLVGVPTLLCTQGWLAPTDVGYARFTGRVISEAAREGPLVRMVATMDDLNLAMMPTLAALAIVLWTIGKPQPKRVRDVVPKMAAALLCIVVPFVAYSRIGIIAAGVIVLAYLVWLGRHARPRSWAIAVTVVGVVASVAAFAGRDYLEILVDRTLSGAKNDDISVSTRVYMYEVAFREIPRHLFPGAGLGASDVVLHAIADPERARGQTLHSMPFRFLIETGVLGFVGYLWLYGATVWHTWRRLVRSESEQVRTLGLALIATAAGWFLVTLVQPLMMLSLLPIVMALSLGPEAGAAAESPSPTSFREDRFRKLARATAMCALVCVLLANVVWYQMLALTLSKAATDLSEGLDAEERGDWLGARQGYGDMGLGGLPEEPEMLRQVHYYTEASNVAQLPILYDWLGLRYGPVTPYAAAEYLSIRSDYSLGDQDQAVLHAETLVRKYPDFAQAWLLYGDILWERAHFDAANEAYTRADELIAQPANAALRPDYESVESKAAAWAASDNPKERLGATGMLRRLGRWDEAVAIARKIVAADRDDAAEAHYVLGVDAEIAGDTVGATAQYRSALAASPNHWDAAQRLQAIDTAAP
jgi:tetratricopeptide (TPR) repeat protein/O-antigen ligase